MESEEEGFPKSGGEALEIGDEFDSEEEADEMPAASKDAMRQPMKANIAAAGAGKDSSAKKPGEVQGKKVED